MKQVPIATFASAALAALSSCVPAADRADDEPEIEIAELARGLTQTSTVTTRGVTATANSLDDWAATS